MSDTPRTDEAVFLTTGPNFNAVCPNFARELERENAALRERLGQAAKDEGALRRENVRLLEAMLHQSDLRADRDRLDWLAENHRRERQSMSEDATKDEGVMLFAHDADGMFTVVTGPTFRAAIDAARKEAQS